MLTARQVLDLALSEPTASRKGQIDAYRRTIRGQDFSRGAGYYVGGAPTHDATLEALLDAAAAQPLRATPAAYVHPRDLARMRPPTPTGVAADGRPTFAPRAGLTPADLAWLDRLPRDPTVVTHADAVALAGLAQEMDSRPPYDPDRRLVESVWAPVRDVHDLDVARADLINARRPTTPVPGEALTALTEAIARETPQLSPWEASQRAQEQLREAVTQREDQRAIRIAGAESRIAGLRDAQRARAAVVL